MKQVVRTPIPSAASLGRRAVRPGAARGSLVAACAVAFAATAAAVYGLGSRSACVPETVTARATIHLDWSAACKAGVASPTPPDLTVLREEIASGDNLRDAVRAANAGPVDLDKIETLRRGLDIGLDPTDPPGGLAVWVAVSGPDPGEAAAVVNHLARQFAHDKQDQWAAAARQGWLGARDAADQARKRWTEAETQTQRFLDEHFAQLQSQAQKLAEWSETAAAEPSAPASRYSPPAPAPSRVARPTGPQWVENPEWTNLTAQIEQLDGQRRALLADRTAAHPEVRLIEDRLAEMRNHLASLPRQIQTPAGDQGPSEEELPAPPDQTRLPPLPPRLEQDGDQVEPHVPFGPRGPTPAPLAPAPIAGAPTSREMTAMGQGHLTAARTFASLRAQCQAARREYDARAAEEREAAKKRLELAPIEVELASVAAPSAAQGQRASLPLVALAAGLAAAASIGLLSYRGAASASFASVEDLQTGLPVPVVGLIGPRGAEAAAQRCGSLLGAAASLAGGVLLTLAIGALALWALGFRACW